MRWIHLPSTMLILAGSVLTAPVAAQVDELSEDDLDRVRAVGERFVDAWLVDAPETVMSTLTSDAVLLPHHGDPPVIGEANIRAFWWPAGAPVKIVEFSQSYDEIDGSGELAFVRGRFELAFEFESEGGLRRFNTAGNYLMLLRRQPDDAWKITHRIWNDPVPEVE